MYKHFSFKEPPTSLIYSASYFNWGVKTFFGGLNGDGTKFWAPVTAWATQIGGSGVRLMRLWQQPLPRFKGQRRF